MSNAMADKVMNAASYSGAAASVISGLTLTEWGIVIGIITALVTLAANLAYQVRKDRREQKLHELEVQHICSRLSMQESQACKVPNGSNGHE